jgi:hypothetical protein
LTEAVDYAFRLRSSSSADGFGSNPPCELFELPGVQGHECERQSDKCETGHNVENSKKIEFNQSSPKYGVCVPDELAFSQFSKFSQFILLVSRRNFLKVFDVCDTISGQDGHRAPTCERAMEELHEVFSKIFH